MDLADPFVLKTKMINLVCEIDTKINDRDVFKGTPTTKTIIDNQLTHLY